MADRAHERRFSARVTASALLAAGLVFTASGAQAANTVTQVQVRDGKVEISASAPPNFTTFTMTNPPRLVVDVAECTFQGVPGEIRVNQYGITSIKTQGYGSGSSAIARVLIAFKKDTDTNISTSGTAIVVAPAGMGATAVAVAAATPLPQAAPAAAAPMPPPVAVAAATPPPPPPPAVEAAPPASPPPAAAAPAPVAEATSPPPAAPMTQAPAPAPVASPEAAAPAPAPALAAAPPPPPEAAPAPIAPLAAAAPPTPPPAEAPPPPPPQENAPLRLAQETPGEQPLMPPAPAPPTPPPPAREEASLTPPPPATGIAVHVSRRTKRLSLVGMRFSASGPSVFVRTNEPVNYQVQDDGNGVRITIENTRIVRKNDTRPLDAQFFDTPVWLVRAKQEKRNVVVRIQLKSQASYQAVQQGTEVQLNFTHG